MRFCSISDLHLMARKPSCRKDDFIETQFRKLEFIFQTAKENGEILFIAGDVFDSPKEPYLLTYRLIKLIKKYKIKVYVIAGQHDMHFHNPDFVNTPLGILISTGLVTFFGYIKIDGISFCGNTWGKNYYKKADVLITHEMVIQEDSILEGKTECKRAFHLLREHDYKLILSGDNHQEFIEKNNGKILINAGSVTRTKKDQKQHNPHVYVIDIDKSGVKGINAFHIPIEKDVFKEEEKVKEVSSDIMNGIKDLIGKMRENEKKKIIPFFDIVSYSIKEMIKNKEPEAESIKNKIQEYFQD